MSLGIVISNSSVLKKKSVVLKILLNPETVKYLGNVHVKGQDIALKQISLQFNMIFSA